MDAPATSTSSTMSERSPPRTSSSTTLRDASRRIDESSPRTRWTELIVSPPADRFSCGLEDRRDDSGNTPGPADVMGAQDAAAEEDAEGVSREVALAPVADL